MSELPEDIAECASLYATRRGIRLEHPLGDGKDGIVFQTSRQTAVKAFRRSDVYARELACYQRLAEHQVEEIRRHAVPVLLGWDDELSIIEMEIVSAPYLLDFADAYLDEAPEFPVEVIEEWHEEKRGQFGERWEEVQSVLAILRGHYGIHLLDVNPDNIKFAGDQS